MFELTAADEARHSEDQMHALELRLDLSDRLQVEPTKHGRACTLLILSRFLDTQSKRVLHDFDESSLARLGHVLRHVLDDRVFR